MMTILRVVCFVVDHPDCCWMTWSCVSRFLLNHVVGKALMFPIVAQIDDSITGDSRGAEPSKTQ